MGKGLGDIRWSQPRTEGWQDGEGLRHQGLTDWCGPMGMPRQIYFIKETAGQQVTGYQLYSIHWVLSWLRGSYPLKWEGLEWNLHWECLPLPPKTIIYDNDQLILEPRLFHSSTPSIRTLCLPLLCAMRDLLSIPLCSVYGSLYGKAKELKVACD